MTLTIRKQFLIGASLLSLLATACSSDPKAATEKNFEQSLNNYFAKYRECITIVGKPDSEGYVKNFPTAQLNKGKDATANFFNGLVKLDLMETSTIEKESRFAHRVSKTQYTYFKFTEAAEPFLRPIELDKGFFATGFRELCYATPEVIAVTNFTEPADQLGVRASSVQFTYKMTQVAPWASEPVFTNRYKWLEEKTNAESLEGKEELVLTNTGWVHHIETE